MNFVNIIRWIAGVTLPLAGTILVFDAIGNTVFEVITDFEIFLFYCYSFLGSALIIATAIILTSLIVPPAKKYGALAALIDYSIIVVTIIWQSYNDSVVNDEPLSLNEFAGLITGLIAGYLLSKKIFFNRGWNKAEKLDSESVDLGI